jgi:hypothetical protein
MENELTPIYNLEAGTTFRLDTGHRYTLTDGNRYAWTDTDGTEWVDLVVVNEDNRPQVICLEANTKVEVLL